MILKLSPNLSTRFPTQTGKSSAYTLFLCVSLAQLSGPLHHHISLQNYFLGGGAESLLTISCPGWDWADHGKVLGGDERDWLCWRKQQGFLSGISAKKPFLSEIGKENMCSAWQVLAEDLTQAAFGQGWLACGSRHHAGASSGPSITISWAKLLGHHYSRWGISWLNCSRVCSRVPFYNWMLQN